MKPITLQTLSEIVGGELAADGSVALTGFALDNRAVKPGDIFLAVGGNKVDGHDFVRDALSAGAVAALVERPVEGPSIIVHNLVAALAKLGSHFRATFSGPVVGVTGSAGKTITKEFIAAALSPLGAVLKTVGNRNTEYTAPLLWAELDAQHKAVVVEMAMRGFGQISHLASFSRPTIGVVTNIGYSHVDLVGSKDGVARAKAELLEALPANGLGVVWQEDDYLEFLKTKSHAPTKTFGFSPESDCVITSYAAESWKESRVLGRVNGIHWEACPKAVGRHIAVNAAAAVLVAAEAGVDPQAAASAISSAEIPPMRMELREFRGATIVMDAYNASPSSTVAAIETLAALPCRGRRLAVIGEMKELGEFSAEGHRLVGEALESNAIDSAIFLGKDTDYAFEACPSVDRLKAADLSDVTRFLESLRDEDTVLIKGSRAMQLEMALEPLYGAVL